MKRNKIVFLLLGGKKKASSRVRGYWIAEELTKQGDKCFLITGQGKLSYLICFYKMLFADVLVLQKRYGRWDYYLSLLLHKLGKKVILDIDDAYSRTENQATLQNITRIMSVCFAVSAGNENLRKFAAKYQKNSLVIPSGIKLENYSMQSSTSPKEKMITLGWIGNGPHYSSDLIEILVSPLKELVLSHKIRIKFVGVLGDIMIKKTFADISGLECDFVDDLDWEDPSKIQEEIRSFDIGLYPIRNTSFNEYKCGFKALEYMALRVPVVASPVGANAEIIEHGVNGYLAKNKSEWVESIHKLLVDENKRIMMGEEGRNKVEKQFSTFNTAKLLSSIWEVDN